MIGELYIERKRADMSAEISSLLTFALDDIKDFSARNCTFSKTIVLPGTKNNNYLFGHIFDVRVSNSFNASGDNVATNFNPAVQADCLMFQNYIQVFKGTIRLLKVIIDNGVPEYEVAVFGELGGLIGALGSEKLEDLDFSGYDTAWTAPTIRSSWAASPGSGVLWPLIDYGGVSTLKVDYDIRAFRPAFYVREILNSIITNAGYTWNSDLFDTDRFKRLVIPNNQKSLQILTNRLVSGVDVTTGQVIIQDGVDDEAPVPQAIRTATDFTYAAGVWTYTGVDTKTFKITATMTGDYYSTIESIQIQIKKNGSQVYTGVPFLTPTFGITDVNFSHSTPDVYVTMATGDTVELSMKVANNVGSYRARTNFVNFQIFNSVPIYTDASPGSTIVMNDVLPKNVTQKDFLASIVRLFNLYIYEDNFSSKKLYIEPYVDFFDLNASGVTDWTYKLDRSRKIEITPMSELNARFYDFKFKEDSDYYNELYRKTYNESYGDRIYDSEYQFSNEREAIECIFSPSVLVGYSGVDKIVSAFYKKPSGTEEAYSVNIRILQTANVTGVTSWSIKDASSVLASGITDYGYAGHYDDPDAPANDIQFGVPRELYFSLATGSISTTQFNVYWSPYMAEIVDKDSKLLTAWFKLTAQDIFDLDFSKLIFCEGSYWRLNKIEDWNASEPDVCKCELLKVINTVY